MGWIYDSYWLFGLPARALRKAVHAPAERKRKRELLRNMRYLRYCKQHGLDPYEHLKERLAQFDQMEERGKE